ncbi:MAG: aminotransferase class V-fold PLP-dependent enzyme [Planctomycetes bacterium]|nr:aminotransferase class V-fold PLP-dependent enzyme [Planctomycetota bacterium]
MSPPSRAVRDACLAMLDDYARHGAAAWIRQFESRERLRARLAQILGAAAEEVALVPGTGHAVSMIATAIDWRPGDRILLLRGEFPTNVTPWQRAALRHSLDVVFLDAAAFARGGEGLELLARELERGVRLLAVSAVQFQTGMRMPLGSIAALCSAAGTQVFVDAIQAAGAVPIDVAALGIDYLAAGGHKWLMGVEGAGLLWIRADRARELEPAIAGWLSHEDGARFLFEGGGLLRYDRPLRRRADVFEIGVTNALGFAALDASTALLAAIGIERIERHVNAILDELESGFAARGFMSSRALDPAARSCILSLTPPLDVDLAALARALAERGVAVSTPDGYLRLAPHWPNDRSQVGPVLDALDDALRAVSGARVP